MLKKNYIIFRNFIQGIEPSSIEPLKELVRKKGTPIFQSIDGLENDGNRVQLILERQNSLVNSVSDFVNEKMSSLFPDSQFSVQPVSVLLSETGCMQQDFHYDYDPRDVKSKICFTSIVFLENGGKFLIKTINGNIKELTFKFGDWCIFKGVVLHAGASYDKDNIRLHFYHDCKGCKRKFDTTYSESLSDEYRKLNHITSFKK